MTSAMIKYHLSLAILLFIIVSCVGRKESLNCNGVKQGRFSFHGHFVDAEFTVERNDTLQTETDQKNRTIFKKKVKWINDCDGSFDRYFSRRSHADLCTKEKETTKSENFNS